MFNSFSENFGLTDGKTYIISRKSPICMEGHIYIDSPTVSRPHAEMKIKNGRIYLRDLNSTNGIYIVENDGLFKFEEGYVNPNQPIVLGNVECTIQNLLAVSGVYSGPQDVYSDPQEKAPDVEDTQLIEIPTHRPFREHKPFKTWM